MRDDPVIAKRGMRNLPDCPLRQMAPAAIIGRVLLQSFLQRQLTTGIRVASHAFVSIIDRSFLHRRLVMWVVAAQATQSSPAFTITAAERHLRIMLQQVG